MGRRRKYTDEQMLDAIREFRRAFGRDPRINELGATGHLIKKRLGWSKALRMATGPSTQRHRMILRHQSDVREFWLARDPSLRSA